MARKSRRFAVSQAALSKRKKLRRSPAQRGEVESPPPGPQPTPVEEVVEEPTLSSESSEPEPQPLSEPVEQESEELATSPWRYAYVLSDLRRIGVFAGAIFVFLGVMTFFLR